jgi:hypothetical protein
MTSRHYSLRLHGLNSRSGTIRARELHEVLPAFPATSGLTAWVLESDQKLAR